MAKQKKSKHKRFKQTTVIELFRRKSKAIFRK